MRYDMMVLYCGGGAFVSEWIHCSGVRVRVCVRVRASEEHHCVYRPRLWVCVAKFKFSIYMKGNSDGNGNCEDFANDGVDVN